MGSARSDSASRLSGHCQWLCVAGEVVHYSSDAHGSCMYSPVDETTRLQWSASNKNSKTKLSSEFVAYYARKRMHRRHGRIVYILNYGMAAGGAFIQWRRVMVACAAAAGWGFRNISNFSGMLRLIAHVFLLTTVIKRNNKGVDWQFVSH